jgi:peptidoglycan/xylan/chitin deacetylase (PgdA/CDA1 family)
LVLGYHNVEPTWCFPAKPKAGLQGMERQFRTLRRVANVVPLQTAIADLAAGRPLPPRAVAVTFDDGYRDNLTLAVPMLEALGLPATFFLVPGLLSNAVMPWWEVISWAVMNSSRARLEWEGNSWALADDRERRAAMSHLHRTLKQRNRSARDEAVERLADELAPRTPRPSADDMFLDWDEAAELDSRGFAIGSHSSAHAILSRENGGEQTRDLTDARRALQDRLSIAADLLAYPNGTEADYDTATLTAAQAAGHTAAVTTREGFNFADTPVMELRRIVIYPERGLTDLLVNLRYAVRGG